MVIPITVASLLSQLDVVASARAAFGLVMVNLFGGVVASVAFALLQVRPTPVFLFLLVLLAGLVFGGRAALSGPFRPSLRGRPDDLPHHIRTWRVAASRICRRVLFHPGRLHTGRRRLYDLHGGVDLARTEARGRRKGDDMKAYWLLGSSGCCSQSPLGSGSRPATRSHRHNKHPRSHLRRQKFRNLSSSSMIRTFGPGWRRNPRRSTRRRARDRRADRRMGGSFAVASHRSPPPFAASARKWRTQRRS